MANVVLTGGGTAGHVIPCLALLPELKKNFDNIHFLGGNGIERELVRNEDIPFHATSVVKLERSKLWLNAKIPFVLLKGIREAKDILKSINPDVVFSKGGYASLPACFAAKSLGVPVVVHESDYTLGLANKITARFAAKVITSFVETEGGAFIGNPVRREITRGNKGKALAEFPVNPNKKTILIFGGSLGAEALNTVVYKGLKKWTERYNILHISGKHGDFTHKVPDYFQIPYTNQMADVYALSDLVVCRAGANTLAELACLGKRAVVVPLPKGNSRGDQLDNALSYQKRGFVEILPQEDLYVETLFAKIEEMWNRNVPVMNLADVNKKIVDVMVQCAEKNSDKR